MELETDEAETSSGSKYPTTWGEWLASAGVNVLQTAILGVVYGAAQRVGTGALDRPPDQQRSKPSAKVDKNGQAVKP